MVEKKADNNTTGIKCVISGICLLVGLLIVALGYLYSECVEQEKVLANLINNNRRVYVYNLEEVLIRLDVHGKKLKFDNSIVKLNNELMDGEKKIKNIKKADVKEDFSDVYLSNLRMKRDELVEEYQKSVEKLNDRIKQALVEIAKEKDASAIFLKSAVAIKTPYVVDLTNEVVKKVKKYTKED